jgi:hypothetical protein
MRLDSSPLAGLEFPIHIRLHFVITKMDAIAFRSEGRLDHPHRGGNLLGRGDSSPARNATADVLGDLEQVPGCQHAVAVRPYLLVTQM